MFQSDSARRFASSLAKEEGLSVHYDPRCKAPHSSKTGRITLPPPKEDESFTAWNHALYREIGYVSGDNRWLFDVYPNEKGEGSAPSEDHATIAKIISDHIVEKSKYGELDGQDLAIDKGRASDYQDISKAVPKGWKSPVRDVLNWDLEDRKEWQGYDMKLCPEIGGEKLNFPLPTNPAEMRELVNGLITGEYDDTGGGGDESGGDGEKSDGEGSGGDQGQGESQPADGGDRSESEGADGSPADGDGDGSGDDSGDTGGSEGDHGNSPVPNRLQRELNNKFKDTKHNPGDVQGSKGDYGKGDYQPLPRQTLVSGDTLDQKGCSIGKRDRVIALATENAVTKSIQKYLTAMTQDAYSYGQKKGRLHSKNIARCYSGQREPRCFKQKLQGKIQLDTAVSLLLDCSGSMGGEPIQIGRAACLSLGNTLSNLRVTHEILGFTDDGSLVTYEFKTFQESLSTTHLASRLCSNKISLANNADGESVALAAERLLYRAEQKKILIVLSDGSPATYAYGNASEHLKGITKKIQEKTPISLHGIGICDNSVRRFYESYVIVNELDELSGVLMTLLKKNLM